MNSKNQQILNASFFDPLVPYIKTISGGRYVEIEIPHTLDINDGEILKYFEDDVVLSYERGKPTRLIGNLKDQAIADYLFSKSLMTTITWK
jgi:hypothetical protein